MTVDKRIFGFSGNMSGLFGAVDGGRLSRRAILGGGAAAMMVGAVPGRACACGSDHPPITMGGVQMDFRARRGSLCWRYLCDVTPIQGTKTALPSPYAIDLEGQALAIDGYMVPDGDHVYLSAFHRDNVADVPGGVAALVQLESDQPIKAVAGLQTIRGVFQFVPNLGDGNQLKPIYRLTQAKTEPFCVRRGPLPQAI